MPGEDDAASQTNSSLAEASVEAGETGSKRTKKEKRKEKKKQKGEKQKEAAAKQKAASGEAEVKVSTAAASSAAATLGSQEKEDEDQPRTRRKGIDLEADPLSRTTKPKNKLFNSDQAKLMVLIMKMVLSSHQLGRSLPRSCSTVICAQGIIQ